MNCIEQLIRELNIKFGDYLDEFNYSLPKLSARFKGDRIPHLHFRHPQPGTSPAETGGALSEGAGSLACSSCDSTVASTYSGGLILLCNAVGLMSSSHICTMKHLDSIIICLELMFRVLVDEHCSAAVFQDVKRSENCKAVFQGIISSLSKRILKLSEEASDDLEITKMDYLNLLYNSIVENLEFLEAGETDFSLVLLSHSVASAVSSPVGKKAPGHSIYRSFALSQSLPLLIYGSSSVDPSSESAKETALEEQRRMRCVDDDDDDEVDDEDRTQWGPVLITIGPQLCDKLPFLQSLQEDFYYKSIDDTPGLYEPIYVSIALEFWKRESVNQQKLSELSGVVNYLQHRVVYDVSVYERLMRVSC